MPYKNKTYVAFDGDNDIRYYWLMKAWRQNDNIDFNFNNAHDLNTARDSSQEDSIKRQLRVRMNNSKIFILLVGEHTKYLNKFVKWEIETAIKLELPIIVVNLNGKVQCDESQCPSTAKNTLAIHIPFGQKIIAYTMDNWPNFHWQYLKEGKDSKYHWADSVYKKLNFKC